MTHSSDPHSVPESMDDLLQRALEHVPEPSSARSEFRESLRAKFSQGGFEADETPGARMERALEDAGTPAADPGFRETLRAQFLNAGAESAGEEESEESAPRRPRLTAVPAVDLHDEEVDFDEEELGTPEPSGGSTLRIVRWLAPLTMAAAAVLLLLNPAIGSKPEWEVIEFPQSGGATWNGQSVTAVDLLPEDRRWSSIATGSERLRLKWSDELLVEVAADSEVTWEPLVKGDAASAEDPNASPCLRAGKGGVNFTARDSDEPVRLFVETPEAKIELRGTTVGVDLIEGLGTCVCVVEGTVTVTTKVGDAKTMQVEEGFSCFIFADGREPSTFDLYEQHGGPVRQFADDGDRHFSAASKN